MHIPAGFTYGEWGGHWPRLHFSLGEQLDLQGREDLAVLGHRRQRETLFPVGPSGNLCRGILRLSPVRQYGDNPGNKGSPQAELSDSLPDGHCFPLLIGTGKGMGEHSLPCAVMGSQGVLPDWVETQTTRQVPWGHYGSFLLIIRLHEWLSATRQHGLHNNSLVSGLRVNYPIGC